MEEIVMHRSSIIRKITRTLMASSIVWFSTMAFAADLLPIERKLENADIMKRVQLIGVIAGGATKTAGVAVIKDSVTGRTYAIKTGDSLPGVANIKLQSVLREAAIFVAAGKEYPVRLSIGGSHQKEESDAEQSADLGKDSGPGLLGRWYEGRLSPVSEDDSRKTQETINVKSNGANLNDVKNQSPTPYVTEMKDAPQANQYGSQGQEIGNSNNFLDRILRNHLNREADSTQAAILSREKENEPMSSDSAEDDFSDDNAD
jgi:hypothetical protein